MDAPSPAILTERIAIFLKILARRDWVNYRPIAKLQAHLTALADVTTSLRSYALNGFPKRALPT